MEFIYILLNKMIILFNREDANMQKRAVLGFIPITARFTSTNYVFNS